MAQTVAGLFSDHNRAQKAIDELLDIGFTKDQIRISRNGNGEDEVAADTGDNSISRFFKSLFNDNNEERYANSGNNESTLITVYAQTKDEAQRATHLLQDYGASDVKEGNDNITETNNSDWNNDRDQQKQYEAYQPKIREDSNSRSGVNDRGALDSISRMEDPQAQKNPQLHEENVRAERNPMDSDLADTGLESFKEGMMELTERKEISIVDKEARVVEEIRIQKERTEREETIQEQVRETKVEVNQLDEHRLKKGDRIDSTSELDYNIQKGYRVENKNDQQLRDSESSFKDRDKKWNNSGKGRDSDPLFGA